MKKILLILVSFVLLEGCVQPLALLGPAITGASTGKIYHAGLSYGTNFMMEKATGKTASEHMIGIINNKK